MTDSDAAVGGSNPYFQYIQSFGGTPKHPAYATSWATFDYQKPSKYSDMNAFRDALYESLKLAEPSLTRATVKTNDEVYGVSIVGGSGESISITFHLVREEQYKVFAVSAAAVKATGPNDTVLRSVLLGYLAKL